MYACIDCTRARDARADGRGAAPAAHSSSYLTRRGSPLASDSRNALATGAAASSAKAPAARIVIQAVDCSTFPQRCKKLPFRRVAIQMVREVAAGGFQTCPFRRLENQAVGNCLAKISHKPLFQ